METKSGGERSKARGRATIYLIDEGGKRNDRAAHFLAGLAFDFKTLGNLLELISRGSAVEEPGVSVVSLLDLTADRTDHLRRGKKAFPGVSIVGVFRPGNF